MKRHDVVREALERVQLAATFAAQLEREYPSKVAVTTLGSHAAEALELACAIRIAMASKSRSLQERKQLKLLLERYAAQLIVRRDLRGFVVGAKFANGVLFLA